MSLSDRQNILYTDTVDVYKPVHIGQRRIGYNDIKDNIYPKTPTYSNVRCFRKTNPKLATAKFGGRIEVETTTANTDEVHFDQAQEIGPNFIIQVKTPNDPDTNNWFYVEGQIDVNNFHANALIVSVQRTTKPRQEE